MNLLDLLALVGLPLCLLAFMVVVFWNDIKALIERMKG
jgi:hypothetical protein